MAFEMDGAQLFKRALRPCIEELERALAPFPSEQAGVRIHGVEALDPLLRASGCIGAVASTVLGSSARPVRAILFNKTAETNWRLPWHQDRTICVRERRDAPGFGPWSVKNGMHHVAPPIDLLARMVTLRAHLDDVPADNAPLLIASGSHAYGRIPVDTVDEIVRQCGAMACVAEAGDVWLYSTLILHASEPASAPASRRVLQVDYAAAELAYGLQWLGV